MQAHHTNAWMVSMWAQFSLLSLYLQSCHFCFFQNLIYETKQFVQLAKDASFFHTFCSVGLPEKSHHLSCLLGMDFSLLEPLCWLVKFVIRSGKVIYLFMLRLISARQLGLVSAHQYCSPLKKRKWLTASQSKILNLYLEEPFFLRNKTLSWWGDEIFVWISTLSNIQ